MGGGVAMTDCRSTLRKEDVERGENINMNETSSTINDE